MSVVLIYRQHCSLFTVLALALFIVVARVQRPRTNNPIAGEITGFVPGAKAPRARARAKSASRPMRIHVNAGAMEKGLSIR